MELNLRGKTALVTGGSSGIGSGISDYLAEEGVRVAVTWRGDDQRRERALAFAEDLSERYGVKCAAVKGDVSKRDELQPLIDQTASELGPIDILVNNAGIWPTESFLETSPEGWDGVLETCLNGPALLSQAVAKQMIEAGIKGRIVNISSKSSFQYTTSGHAHYAVAKAGLNMLTRALARELSEHGIGVVGIAPGMIATPMNAEKWDAPGAKEAYESRIPVGRFAQAREIGYLVAFLVSDKGVNLCGTTVDATGGMLC